MSPDTGIIIYWGEKITDQRARVLAPDYVPDEILKLIEILYKDPYGYGGQNWREPKWGKQRPQLYPGMSMFDPGYWCSVIGDMVKYYYEELGRFGNQLGPAQPGTVPGLPGPGWYPVGL